MKWVKWLLFDFQGRAGVFHMWVSVSLYIVFLFPIAFAKGDSAIQAAILITGIIAAFFFKICIGVKRCHDLGWGGERLLYMFIPIVNIIVLGPLYFWPGKNEDNEYGSKTKWFGVPDRIVGLETTQIAAEQVSP